METFKKNNNNLELSLSDSIFFVHLQILINESEFEKEHNLQTIVFEEIKKFKPNWIVFSVPNGGKRNSFEMLSIKAEGQLDGVSDLIILGEFPTAYFVEMKGKKTPWTDSQKKFKAGLESLGWKYLILKKE
jgi:hypothetical protein